MTDVAVVQETPQRYQRLSLLDLLKSLLDQGVVADGELLLTVADIDLVYLGLKCVLASVETLRERSGEAESPFRAGAALWQREEGEARTTLSPPSAASFTKNGTASVGSRQHGEQEMPFVQPAPREKHGAMSPSRAGHVKIDPAKVERGLMKLVLTIVELLRRLMEHEALRRVEGGALGAQKIEELGQVFLRLHEKMQELKQHFDLKDEDLNLDLGPLGNLM